MVADAQHQQVMFEATDSVRAVRWYADASVSESGECVFEITNCILSLLKEKAKLAYDIEMTIYEEDDYTKLDIDNNTFVLNKKSKQGQFPNMNGVFDVEPLETQPLVDINVLIASLKAMASGGVTSVLLNLQQGDMKKIKLIGERLNKLHSTSVETLLVPLRKY